MGKREHDGRMMIHSKITGKLYDDNQAVHIVNVLQIYKFLCNGATLLDLFPSHGADGEERLCFVISKEEFDLLQPLWVKHKL